MGGQIQKKRLSGALKKIRGIVKAFRIIDQNYQSKDSWRNVGQNVWVK